MQAALDTWSAGGINWLKDVGMSNAPLWAWPSFAKLMADPYVENTELSDMGESFAGFNGLCAMQMLKDLLGKCVEQWEAAEGDAAGNDLPGWDSESINTLVGVREMMGHSLERLVRFLEHVKQGGMRSQVQLWGAGCDAGRCCHGATPELGLDLACDAARRRVWRCW